MVAPTRHKGSEAKLFVAIDSNSLIHRAFHAFPPNLVTTSGVQVNAVFGFTSMLLRVLETLDPAYLVCAFDMKAPTFRHAEFSDYKATRKPTDHTLIEQFPLVKEVLAAFNVPIVEREGYEADDILGTFAADVCEGKWANDRLELLIVTGDRDLLQVVNDRVHVWLPHGSFKNMKMYDEKEVVEYFGFMPDKVPDYKGLVGDASDNIPGVKGIGDKTAKTLIRTYGTLDGIYGHIDEIPQRQQTLLKESEEVAALSRKLATIDKTIDHGVKLQGCLMRDFRTEDVITVFQKFEFRSLMGKIPKSINGNDTIQMGMFQGQPVDESRKTQGQGTKMEVISPEGNDSKMEHTEVADIGAISGLKSATSAAIVFFDKGPLMVSITSGEGTTCYYADQSDARLSLEAIMTILESISCEIVTYGWQELCVAAVKEFDSTSVQKKLLDVAQSRVYDCILAAYQLSSGQRDYSFKGLSFAYSGVILPEDTFPGREYTKPCLNVVVAIKEKIYGELDTRSGTIGEKMYIAKRPIDRGDWKQIDTPLSVGLADMSCRGVAIQPDILKKKQKQLLLGIEELEQKIYESIGHEFNVGSSRQLADVLFNELRLPVQKKRKTGPSTDESVLQKLVDMHPCIRDVLAYRERVKMENTYLRPLLEYSEKARDGRIHSTFSQIGTTSGRLTSSEPNLQNIPIRSELGKEIRDMFIAPKGKVLVSADYSQIDLRVMAHFSLDPLMVEDFERGADFHVMTAVRLLGKEEKNVGEEDRRIAKTINFGVLYGLSAFGLSETLGIGRDEAATYIESYFEKYAGIKNYIDSTLARARDDKYVETITGRRRYISSLGSQNFQIRSAAEREAVNHPIQGTSADIMRIAMNDLYRYILSEKRVALVLQIHDEFLLECSEDVYEKVGKKVKNIMESAVTMMVPLVGNVEYGTSLAAMNEL